MSAAVYFDSGTHRSASFGFPLETVTRQEDLNDVIRDVLDYFAL